MLEAEFDERMLSIKKDLNEIFNSPLVQTHTIDPDKGLIIDERNHFRKLLIQIAANITQIEDGIKKYNRPKDWALLQEGV